MLQLRLDCLRLHVHVPRLHLEWSLPKYCKVGVFVCAHDVPVLVGELLVGENLIYVEVGHMLVELLRTDAVVIFLLIPAEHGFLAAFSVQHAGLVRIDLCVYCFDGAILGIIASVKALIIRSISTFSLMNAFRILEAANIS